ncbi:MAG TPA: family 16 glycoside hydrolase [Anaerolineales bacterium]|nr:family 16 glycoside hydrolase [Anaerolineales bacterium]
MPVKRAWLASLFALALASLACNLARSAATTAPADEGEMTLAEAVQVTPEDARPEVLRLMGPPDSFTLQWQDLDGTLVRWEEWSYFDAATRFDFLDGELVWTGDLDPVVDATVFAHAYSPMDFEPTMTTDDVRSMLADQTLEEASLAEADIPTGIILAGDQILLGFDNDRLVYVQSFALIPDESAPTPAASAPTMEAPATSAPTPQLAATSAPAALLSDDFQSPSPAAPLFGTRTMTFTLASGEGALTSLYPGGVVPVMYAAPVVADFALEVAIRFPDAAPSSAAGIIFRSDDTPDGLAYYYHLTLRPAASLLELAVWKDGAFSPIKMASIPTGGLDVDGANHLRLEARGDQLRVWINNVLTLEVSDTRLPGPGLLGLSIVSSQSPETVYFDNLRVEALP